MINVKKGIAHSLTQSDAVGAAKDNEGVVAGMLVAKNTSGEIVKSAPANTAAAAALLLGFAVNNQTDGDVIESKKIGMYSLDGNSVIETDQVVQTITTGNFPIGAPVYSANGADAGKVTSANTIARVIGYVDGVRSLPTVLTVSGKKVQGFANVLAIKLAV